MFYVTSLAVLKNTQNSSIQLTVPLISLNPPSVLIPYVMLAKLMIMFETCLIDAPNANFGYTRVVLMLQSLSNFSFTINTILSSNFLFHKFITNSNNIADSAMH